MRLNLVDIFYPLRIILVNMLNEIVMGTDIFIPVSVYLLEILESSHFKGPFKEKHHTQIQDEENSSNGKNKNRNSHSKSKNYTPDIHINLKLRKEDFKNYGIVNYLLEQVLDSLWESTILNCYKYSFPAFAFGIIYHLKKVQKNILVIYKINII
jgi:hypothetical protein